MKTIKSTLPRAMILATCLLSTPAAVAAPSCERLVDSSPEQVELETLTGIHSGCASTLLNGADRRLSDSSGDTFGAALKRALIIRQNTPEGRIDHTLFGVQTGLEEVLALRVDAQHRELVLINRSGSGVGAYGIASFSTKFNGNVGPARFIRIREEGDFRAIAVDAPSDRLYVGGSRRVLVYPRLANSTGRTPEVQVEPLASLSGPLTRIETIVDLAVDSKGDRLIVLHRATSGEQELLIFPRSASGEVAPQHIKSGGAIDGAARISFDSELDRLTVFDSSGTPTFLGSAELLR